jgi:phosphodiesterase/alkaline phosphatase D-like protein
LTTVLAIASHVRIVAGPEIERVDPDFAIVRWTSTTPGGSPVHEGVVHYGTEPAHLDRTAQSPVRLNPGHRYTVFRVRLDGLRPRTTYYYRVDSRDAGGTDDGAKSPVLQFTTR